MTLNEYVELARKTNQVTASRYPNTYIHHQLLGLIGEVGELSEKFKKFERDVAPATSLNNHLDDKYCLIDNHEYSEQRNAIAKEFGDIFWYLCILADTLEFDCDEILQMNIDKLQKRYNENKINGEGDER